MEININDLTDILVGEEGLTLEEKLVILEDMILDFKASGDDYSFVEEVISNIEIEIRDQKLISIGI
jgi:hypothetical protein